MSFQAYLDNIQSKTGKTPDEFRALAGQKGFTEGGTLRKGVKAGEIVAWLGQEFALGEAVLHQAGVDVDRARQCDAVDGLLLIIDAIGREPGQQGSDQCDEADDKAQPSHSFTQIC